MAVYRDLEYIGAQIFESTSKDEGLEGLLRDAGKDPTLLDLPYSITLLAKETSSTLFGLMMRGDEEPSLSASLRTDSLIGIELRNWFRQKGEVDLTVLELVNSYNILHLGEHAATKPKEKVQARL